MKPNFGAPAVAVALLFVVGPGVADDKEEPAKIELTDDESAIVRLTNEERAKAGMKPLKPNPILCSVARGHCANMVKQNKVDHVLDGKTPAKRVEDAGYACTLCGENLGFGPRQWTPRHMVDWWMGSKPHRANIVHKDFQEIGIAVVRADNGEVYFAQVFCVPAR
jgi:uncharacterized protein YkwD